MQFKLGRNRAPVRAPRLSLRNYLTRALPTPPASVDYSPAAAASLSQVYLNDRLGDCVPACIAHVVGVLTGNAGAGPALYTQQQIVALYSAIGGYNPNAQPVWDGREWANPTDAGCNEQTALDLWQQQGAPAGSHQIAGYLAVNPADPAEYRAALWLFENLVYGLELPDSWTQVRSSGFVWDVAQPNPRNGHCVAGVGYDSTGVRISTWGMTGTITDRAMAAIVSPMFGGELWVVISQDAINKATTKAPNGLDWSQLVADFDAIGGHLPAPITPPPVPVTPPAPPTPGPAPQPIDWSALVGNMISELQAIITWVQSPAAAPYVSLGESALRQIVTWLLSQKPASAAHCETLMASCPHRP